MAIAPLPAQRLIILLSIPYWITRLAAYDPIWMLTRGGEEWRPPPHDCALNWAGHCTNATATGDWHSISPNRKLPRSGNSGYPMGRTLCAEGRTTLFEVSEAGHFTPVCLSLRPHSCLCCNQGFLVGMILQPYPMVDRCSTCSRCLKNLCWRML